jgi:hypothetical protein
MQMIANPCVSVLMPVRNCELYVAQAIQSILDQSTSSFELILIDDGSSDSTLRILKGFTLHEPRIHLISRGNRGLIYSLNEGLEAAHGEYIARMDGDDIALPDRFAQQVSFLDQHPECGAVGCATQVIDSIGNPICVQRYPNEHSEIVSACLRGYGAIPHPGAMFRRKSVLALGGYREPFVAAEDLDLWLRLAENWKLANLPGVLLAYRVHLESISLQSRELQIRSARKAVLEACQRGILTPPDETIDAKTRIEADRTLGLSGWCHLALSEGNYPAAMNLVRAMVRIAPFKLEPYIKFLNLALAWSEAPLHRLVFSISPTARDRAAKGQTVLARRHKLHESGLHRQGLSSAWESVIWYPTLISTALLFGSLARVAKSFFSQCRINGIPPRS